MTIHVTFKRLDNKIVKKIVGVPEIMNNDMFLEQNINKFNNIPKKLNKITAPLKHKYTKTISVLNTGYQ